MAALAALWVVPAETRRESAPGASSTNVLFVTVPVSSTCIPALGHRFYRITCTPPVERVSPTLEAPAPIRIHCTTAGMWVVPAETVQNMDVLDAPTWMYSRHVSAGTTHSAANAATYPNEAAVKVALFEVTENAGRPRDDEVCPSACSPRVTKK